jgi:isopenicillin N synthase-like dioxygenase
VQELITLMSQDVEGLQFMFPPHGGSPHAGEWVDVPCREGQIAVIVNDMMERFTNGA